MLSLNVKIVDCVLEDEVQDQLPTSRIGCFVQYDGQFVDALMIHGTGQMIKPDNVTLNLEDSKTPNETDPKLVLIVKDIENDEPYVGSVSIARSILKESNRGQVYSMWVTLFDDQGDDEYDGQMGLNDDEEPRVQLELTISEVQDKKDTEKPKRAKSPQKGYMGSIGNTRESKRSENPSGALVRTTPSPDKSATKAAPLKSPNRTSQVSLGRPKSKSGYGVSKAGPSTIQARAPIKLLQVEEITSILDRNNSKRQNVRYLKDLLDAQLNTLCSNLKVMQNDNSEIETETIQRLQLIEKFGDDANQGLHTAKMQNTKIIKKIQEQKESHAEVLAEQTAEQKTMRDTLAKLEKNLKQLRMDLEAKQTSHRAAVMEKQEMLQQELNNTSSKGMVGDLSPRRKDEIATQRQNLHNLNEQRSEGMNGLKDLKRQLPTLTIDFLYEVDKQSNNIDILIEQNSQIKSEILSMEEERTSQKLIAKLADEKIKIKEFELAQLQAREKQLEAETNEFIEKGDNQYNQLRQEVRVQDEVEQALGTDINELANKSNMLLRAKLKANKADFERLIQLGQGQGAIGAALERKVAENDKDMLAIVKAKKDAHKGLTHISDVMKCDIGKDQKPYEPDLTQVEHTCGLLDEIDKKLQKGLMPKYDLTRKQQIANMVANGLWDIMNGDKMDLEQLIEFNSSGMNKLHKMTAKHNTLKEKQFEDHERQTKTLQTMTAQIDLLSQDKDNTLAQITKAKKELESLKAMLQQKREVLDERDEEIARLESLIDAKFDEMEKLEEEIAIKNAIIRDLQNQLNALLNRKPEPEKPKNQFYIPVKGDLIDEKLAEYINEVSLGSPVPWKRISEGNYIYGTKKVSVKYMRNHLIIKVGGGSMMVEEFVANYEDIELAKINYKEPGKGVPLNPDQSGLTKQQKVNIARGASPRNPGGMGSPKAADRSPEPLPTAKGFKR